MDKDAAKRPLDRDVERTRHDLPGLDGADLGQEVDDTVRQVTGEQDVPPPNQPAD